MTTLSPAEAYRLLAPTYDSLPNPLLSLEQRTTSHLLPRLAGQCVADIAAGCGRWARYCRRHGAFAIAIDFCEAMLLRAPSPRVLADARALPLRDACADVAIFSFGLGYAPDSLPEVARIVRPGGTVIVSDVHPDALRGGWRRSFRVRERVIEVASSPYDIGELKVAGLRLTHLEEPHFAEEVASSPYDIGELKVAGLRLTHLEEPHFAEMERLIFEQAGKPDAFDQSQPAIFVSRWEKL